MSVQTQSGYNVVKLRGLRMFLRNGPMSAHEWAIRMQYYPVRRAYFYLNTWRKYRLLTRRRSGREFLYSLTPRGQERIAWLVRTSDHVETHVSGI